MKYYECDYCQSRISVAEVILKGIVGTSGGILLPESFHKKHFCDSECFWYWIDKFQPKTGKK